MQENFTIEILSPDKTFLKSQVSEVEIPSYEGLLGILKDHVPLITFLRPGFIKFKENNKDKIYFVEDGIVEFINNNLLILSPTVRDLDSFKQTDIKSIVNDAKKAITNESLSDKEKYILSYKIATLEEIN
tara:strand:- start:953 stop:1342 length:390 start_codon:yes stop_codon:yes gene_type:complete